MQAQIIAVSGSPIKNSNTDRMVQAICEASGRPYEFVKLSKLKVQPCLACLGCKKDNVCKVNDDFPALAEKIKSAHALVVGCYSPYAGADAFTRSFLERLFSLRHQNGLNRGKLAVVVATGIGRGIPGLDNAAAQVSQALEMEGMNLLGQVKVTGNPECMVCGYGETCPMSALPWVFGQDSKITPEKFSRAEDQAEVWQQGLDLGRELGQAMRKQFAM
ncbi:NADPH-dependent FMN reductase [Desulfocarbo indianensis]|nr:NADPH-dependent FMN reductase [Desulfocarbo indianensis]